MAPRPREPSAQALTRERWRACLELDGQLARMEPSWSPAENYYYPLRSEPLSGQAIAEAWRQALAKGLPEGRGMTSLYLHVPFCREKCRYCVYYSLAGPDPAEVKAYLRRLHEEIGFYAPVFSGTRFDAWSIGGGTPTALDADDLDGLLAHLRRAFVPKEGASLEFETNPYTATQERVRAFEKHGFNRVSFGVQSFSPAVLAAVGRGYQTTDHVRRCMELLRAGGFRVNMDLLYGLPGGGAAETLASAASAMELRPDSVVIYPLSAGTPPLPGASGQDAAVPFAGLASSLAGPAGKLGFTVHPDWFSVRLHTLHSAKTDAPPAYDDLHAGPLLLMGLGPTSRGHVYGKLAYRHAAYPPGSPFQPALTVAQGWSLTPEDEMRMQVTRTLSRTGRIDATDLERMPGGRAERRFGRDLGSLVRLGALSRDGKGYRRSQGRLAAAGTAPPAAHTFPDGAGDARPPASTARHAAELYLLGERVRRGLKDRIRRLGAAGIVNQGIGLYAAGERSRAAGLFRKAAKLDPDGVGGAVLRAIQASASFQAVWEALKVHADDRRLELGPLEDVLAKVRKLVDSGIRLYAAGERARAARLFKQAAALDPGGAGPALGEAARGAKSLQALSDALKARGGGRSADQGPLDATLAKIRMLNSQGVRLFAAGERAKAARCFAGALRL
ncbi:MAG: radical SAM protein, partial [Elusimicrobia bacterium]|nr:radical SAM protein [Elusimicrobiota bacterium]